MASHIKRKNDFKAEL